MIQKKRDLSKIIREIGEVFTASAAAHVLNIPNAKATKALSRWAEQGWITRIRRGLYALVPIEAQSPDQALEDSWLIIPDIFSPGYVGGWSAAEHWDMTEQIFRDLCILTERPVLHKKQEIHQISFFVTHIPAVLNFGTETIWKKNKKIPISDPHKTILDMFYNPQLGGGIQHVIDCFFAYCQSNNNQPEKLANYAEQFHNGAVFKRLGFLAEKFLGKDHLLTHLCKAKITQGLTYLDPSLKIGKIVNKWRLIVPQNLNFRERQ